MQFRAFAIASSSQIRFNRPIKSKIAHRRSVNRCAEAEGTNVMIAEHARQEYKHRRAPKTYVLTSLNRLPLDDNELAIQSGEKRLRTLNLKLTFVKA
ncbi:hypothetical protein AVEN_159461-1 [Araneus ventricosus]|uniref:Uncharacterized protein n=1 Tax=Araneus ventricosus TaxID=182803 RepID=A0A4Y2A0Z2_ARAVE|nr:hypothetical protein AVEN_159461-1 [Araneus ventricosus]